MSQIDLLIRLGCGSEKIKAKIMTQRINFGTVEPAAYKAMLGLERYLSQCGLESKLLHLIKVRASQINHCAFCTNMHLQEAKKAGETEQRLCSLDAWQETSCFTLREKAALAFTEAVTLIASNSIGDRLYQQVSHHFSDNEILQILTAIATINAWNRIAIATRMTMD